jgi:aminopeptidase N
VSEFSESCRRLGLIAGEKVFAPPDAPEHPPRDRTFLLHHVRLEITIDDRERMVSGTVSHRLSPINDGLKEVALDAGDLNIRKVVDDGGHELEWELHGETLLIHLPKARKAGEAFELRISYDAKPRKGIFFTGPDKANPKRPRITWTQGEDTDNRYWFPSYDYPNQRFTSEVLATVDEQYEALSNGRLVNVSADKRRKTKTYHWSLDQPHSNYLIALAVGEFESKEWDTDGIPVLAHVPKGLGSYLDRTFGNVPDMVRYFGEVTGQKYPWPRYAQVCVPEFVVGGMENTSMTTLTEYCLTDEKAYEDYRPDSLLAHELAHQWFGDFLTCRAWGHIWLNESFATYFQVLWWEHFFGPDDALMELEADRDNYHEEASKNYKRPIVTMKFVEPSDMFDRHTYEKGANVLHMMRNELGDDLWWKAIRLYVKKFAGQNVETNDFKEAIEEATGRNLDVFFDQWLYHAGHPEFELSWSWDESAKQVELRTKQTQEVKDPVPLFKLSASVGLVWPDRIQQESIRIEKADQVFRFDAPRRPRAVLFDPEDRILKKVTFKKPRDELLWQLANVGSVWPRIEACRDLGKLIGDPKAIEGLEEALKKDKFWAVRREAAVALGAIGTTAARDALLGGAKDKDSRVRRGVYRALGNFRKDEGAFKALAKAYREDGWYYPMNAAALALAETRHEQAFETIVRGMDRRSQGEILARGACMAIANLRDQRGFPELEKRTSDAYFEMVRYGAAWALGKLGSFHESRRDEVLEDLSMLVRDANYRTRLGATLGLGELGYPKAEDELQRVSDAEPMSNLRTNARKAIAVLREKHAEAAKKVEQQEELDKLKDENKELRARLTAVEARVDSIGKRRKR